MVTIPRLGFTREEDESPRVDGRRKGRCARSQKIRHPTEGDALEALRRVRDHRRATESAEDRLPESRVYPCKSCGGWHLTSAELHPADLDPVKEQMNGEDLAAYAKRLERRIAEQRSHILSLHALGAGASNRAARHRISSLVIALGRMTERWENERRNRAELVRQLDEMRSRQSWRRRRR